MARPDQTMGSEIGTRGADNLDSNGLMPVPTKPSAAMLAAGSQAGDVSVEQAWRIYQAMVRAAA